MPLGRYTPRSSKTKHSSHNFLKGIVDSESFTTPERVRPPSDFRSSCERVPVKESNLVRDESSLDKSTKCDIMEQIDQDVNFIAQHSGIPRNEILNDCETIQSDEIHDGSEPSLQSIINKYTHTKDCVDDARDEKHTDNLEKYIQRLDTNNANTGCSFDTGIHTVPLSNERFKKGRILDQFQKQETILDQFQKREKILDQFQEQKKILDQFQKQINGEEVKPLTSIIDSNSSDDTVLTQNDGHDESDYIIKPQENSIKRLSDENSRAMPSVYAIYWPQIATAAALYVMEHGGDDKLAELASSTVLETCSGKEGSQELLEYAASRASNKALDLRRSVANSGLVAVAVLRAGNAQGVCEASPSEPNFMATYFFLSCCSLKFH